MVCFSLSPSDQAPLSLTDRYLSDYKKRLLEMENDKEGEKNGNSGSDDLEVCDWSTVGHVV